MVTRTIASDPWSLDKHLVVMQWYEKKSAIEELSFNQASFWVQLHCSPLCYMTTEATTKISLVIREVAQPIVLKDSEGGGGGIFNTSKFQLTSLSLVVPRTPYFTG